jgi:hypothetical protein
MREGVGYHRPVNLVKATALIPIALLSFFSFPLAAQQPEAYKIAVVGLVHSHV